MKVKILWALVIIVLSLLGSCTKKSTCPIQPTVYLMKDYFPLNIGNEWIWEIVDYSIPQSFLDGDVNLGEPFEDNNGNGIYDIGIDHFDATMDLNRNGRYDGPYDPWTPGIPYEDRNDNGQYDSPNGKWDEGEPSAGLTAGIGVETSVSSDGSVIFCRRSGFLEPGGFFGDLLIDDGFSNDSLGLRWHCHSDSSFLSQQDDLKDHTPITIARASTKIGDTVSYADTTSPNYIWISIFEVVEDVTVPAGTFQNCLKFKTIASEWIGNMAKYNGTSFQWYAKNVGLVKSEGPKTEEHWRLKSAEINGKSYP